MQATSTSKKAALQALKTATLHESVAAMEK
jgi:hypothetical protein